MCSPQTRWDHCVEFHGHSCPGLAIGYRVALAATDRLGVTFAEDQEIVCVTENDACGVDAVQVLTGCTMGKGNLLYRDNGKQVFSFFNRRDQSRIRIMFNKQIKKDKDWDKEQFQNYILEAPEEEILSFSEPSFEPPQRARMFNSITCEQCGENASEHKIRLNDGKKICLDCFVDYSRGWRAVDSMGEKQDGR